MTHIEEKLYLQSVFNAIDEVYKFKSHHHHQQQTLTYEERLRASFNKLLLPDWYNHDYTSINELRKTKSYGQVLHTKQYVNNTSNLLISSSNNSTYLSNDTTHRHRLPSQSRSEQLPSRRNSTTLTNDTNGNIIIDSQRSTNSHETSTYASGLQRVIQSSTWYKPKIFTKNNINDYSIKPPKPLPRYSKIHQEHINSTDSSFPSSTPKIIITDSISNENIRHPIKPRTMSQVSISSKEIDDESLLQNISLDISSDGDITIVQKSTSSRTDDVLSLTHTPIISNPHIITTTNNNTNQSMTTNISRTNSTKSISSDGQSYHSVILPSSDRNLLVTDSSSYASVNDQCLSATTSSYYTAVDDDISSSSSSLAGYETPTLKLDNEILSSHSSLSDLSHTETLEPNVEGN
ncbi:unnamed protein product [Rotaria sordida]|uniref:Uncharacterized protein n=1 Tax=Rotaria sordida TaxID=392033 RepID=A0A814N353_9BILA|nr:unnamed protein product [Rotaria sordida]CAF3853672.1 unnamed protein product [Rotaria sordida]